MSRDTFIGVMVGLIVATFAGNLGLAMVASRTAEGIAQNLQPQPTPTPTVETPPSPSPSPPPQTVTPQSKPIPALW